MENKKCCQQKEVCVSTRLWSESHGNETGLHKTQLQIHDFFPTYSIHRQVMIYSFSVNQCWLLVNSQFEFMTVKLLHLN